MDYTNAVTPLFPQQPNADAHVDEMLSPTPGGVLDSLLRSEGYWQLLSSQRAQAPVDAETSDNVIAMVRDERPDLAPLVNVAIACR